MEGLTGFGFKSLDWVWGFVFLFGLLGFGLDDLVYCLLFILV